MKNIIVAPAAVLLVLLLMVAPVQAASVNNISLQAACTTGVAGMATVIVGDVSGPNPYHNVEINVMLNQSPAQNMVFEGWLIDSKTNSKYALGAFNKNRLNYREKTVGTPACMSFDTLAVSVEPANKTTCQPNTIISKGCLPGTSVSAADFPGSVVLPEDESFQRQLITARFCITNDQYNSLRMQGWSSKDVSVMANAATRCNKKVEDVAAMLSQGQSWDQIASACGTSTASIMQPVPQQQVAGCQQAIPTCPTPVVSAPVSYQTYANCKPVVTRMDWIMYQRAGFSWQDVAIAANIAAMTGEPVAPLLHAVTMQNSTWKDIAYSRNLFTHRIYDVSGWPFSRTGMEQLTAEDQRFLDSCGGCVTTTTPGCPAPTSGY